MPHAPRRSLLLLLASLAAGCGDESAAPTTATTAANPPRIGVVLPMFRHPYFVAMRDAIAESAKGVGAEVDIRDGQDDDQKQIVQVQALLASKIDALLLCPRDENAAIPAVEAANRAGVPVILVNRRVNGGKVAAYVGADDVAGGRAQGEELVRALGTKGGKIIYLQGTQGSSPQVSRSKGLHESLDKHPEVVFAADQFTDFQEDKAKSVMSGLVRRFQPGEVRALVAQADELALPAAEVARAAGWKDLIVIGFNGTKPAFDAIKAGTLRATILQDAAEQGRLGLAVAAKTARKDGLAADIPTALKLVTKETVGGYKPSY